MKRRTNIVLVMIVTIMCAAFLLTGTNAWALDYTYTESGGEITITGYTGSGGDVENGVCVECLSDIDCNASQVCDVNAYVCGSCIDNADCSDGQFCNGIESCVSGECTFGSAPCDSGEVCSEDQGGCFECLSDIDCDAGQVCNVDVGRCDYALSTMLTPCSGGTIYSYYFMGPEPDGSLVEAGLEAFSDFTVGMQEETRQAIIGFDLSSLQDQFELGKIQAVLQLTPKNNVSTSSHYLACRDVPEDASDCLVVTSQSWGWGGNSETRTGAITAEQVISFDVTAAVENYLFGAGQNGYAEFNVSSIDLSTPTFYYDSVQFYDHTDFEKTPKLIISYPPCFEDGDCAAGQACDVDTGECVECISDADCVAGQVCDVAAGECVECLGDADCAAGQICENDTGTCTDASPLTLTPCSDGTLYYHKQTAFDYPSFEETDIESGLTISALLGSFDTIYRQGLVGFDLASAQGRFIAGATQAQLRLVAKNTVSSSTHQLRCSDVPEAYNDCSVSVLQLSKTGANSSTRTGAVIAEQVISFDVTDAVENYLFGAAQNGYAEFLLVDPAYMNLPVEFYDHTDSEKAPQLIIRDLCVADSDCDDDLFCTGADTCVEGICVVGSAPCGVSETCDEATDSCPECVKNTDCGDGYECVEGMCEVATDEPPEIGDDPFLAAGTWPVLPTSADNPMYLEQNDYVLWTFSDDYAAGCEDCTHVAEYQAVGAAGWTGISVASDKNDGYAYAQLPITSLLNATTYAFRFSVTDCASQSAQSQTYYFRVATEDNPPVIEFGPFLAAGTWPALPGFESRAFVIAQDEYVLWTFNDDYASCSDMTWHRARYRKIVDDGTWIWEWLDVSTDSTEKEYAYARIPASSMEAGTYMFVAEIIDCDGQLTRSPKFYFKVEQPQ